MRKLAFLIALAVFAGASMYLPLTATLPLGYVQNPPIVSPAYYVSTTGSDSNSGTFSSPFATLYKCARSMEASSTTKTCYVRSGTYTPAADPTEPTVSGFSCDTIGGAAGVPQYHSAVFMNLAGDSGVTFSYYPPDGVDSPILNGQAQLTTESTHTASSSGTTLTVTTNTGVAIGDVLSGGSWAPGTLILSGPSGLTWTTSYSQTVSPTTTTFQYPASGLGCGFTTRGAGSVFPTNITINGFTLENFGITGAISYDNGGGITFINNVITNATYSFGTAALVIQCADTATGMTVSGDVIAHNSVTNVIADGIRFQADLQNSSAGCGAALAVAPQVTHNYVQDSDLWTYDGGAIYIRSIPATTTAPMQVSYNYLKDVNPHLLYNGYTYSPGIYYDGYSQNINTFYNVVEGTTSYCVAVATGSPSTGGMNTEYNICDGEGVPNTLSGYYAPFIFSNNITGTNLFEYNIIVSNTTGTINTDALIGTGNSVYATLENNVYFNYAPGGSVSYVCGAGACASGATNDTNPILQPPQIACWGAFVADYSPVFTAPLNWTLPVSWGAPGFWGPPGYTGWVSNGSTPSFPTASCTN